MGLFYKLKEKHYELVAKRQRYKRGFADEDV